MKKSLFFIIALILALGLCLTACRGNSSNTPNVDNQPSHTHKFGEWITTKNSTCGENGEMARHCECGEKQTKIIPSTGKHKLDEYGMCNACTIPELPTDGIIYEKSDDNTYAIVVGCQTEAEKIKIADTYEGLPVTSIDQLAFCDCRFNSIVIPYGVTSIGEWAFYDCDNLNSIIIPNSVLFIDEWAFNDCDSLTSVLIGDCVNSIGFRAFSNCNNLSSVIISGSVISIEDMAFSVCKSLISIEVNENNKRQK